MSDMKRLVVTLTIEKLASGGVSIDSDDVPGLLLDGANPRSVFADLGPMIRTILVNESIDWLRSDDEIDTNDTQRKTP